MTASSVRPVVVALGIAALFALGACGGSQPMSSRLVPAAETPAPGTHRELCPVTSDHGQVTLALDLASEFGLSAGCGWSGSPGSSSGVALAVSWAPHRGALRKEYDAQKPFALDGDEPEGDDSVLALDLRQGVAALGRARGDRLSYFCFCDGQNGLYRSAMADGVRVTLQVSLSDWDPDLPERRRLEDRFDQVVRSAGVVG